MAEFIRCQSNSINNPGTILEIENWSCDCHTWPIVVATYDWSNKEERWKKQGWFVRPCGYCHQYPTPSMEERLRE